MTSGSPGPAHDPDPARTRRWLVAALFLLILTRIPALIHPNAIDDERIYATVAQEMLHGGLPYLSAVERKPPLLFGLYATVLGVAGRANWPALHLVALVWTLATMAAIGLLLRRLFDPRTGLLGAALYGLYLMWGDYRNLAFNGEMLMNLPVALAYLLTLGPDRRRARPELLAAGALIALAFLLKQPSGIAGLPLGLYVLSGGYRHTRGLDWADSLWHATELALGFALMFLATGLLLAHEGILHEAWYWTVLDHRSPVGPSTLHFWEKAIPNTGYFLLGTLPLWLGAAASARGIDAWTDRRPERNALFLLLAVSLLGVSASGQFLFHYYLQFLPPLCLLATPPLSAALAAPARRTRWLPAGPALRAWLVASLVIFLVIDTIGTWQQRKVSPAAAWLAEHSSPADRIFVWGQGGTKTGIYLQADRRPAGRFVSIFPLTGHVFGGYPAAWGPQYEDRHILPGAWDSLAQDFAAHPPRFFVDAEESDPRSRYPTLRYPWLDRLLRESYQPVVRVDDAIIYQRLPGAIDPPPTSGGPLPDSVDAPTPSTAGPAAPRPPRR